jgi:hypothetical protein
VKGSVSRVIGGLSIGESQRPTTFAIVSATGQYPDVFAVCHFVKRYRLATAIGEISEHVAESLKLDRLRQDLAALRGEEFDNARCELVVDASLAGAAMFAPFERAHRSKDLDVARFVALQVTNGSAISPAEYRQGATWYRIPKVDLAATMLTSLDPRAPRFSMGRSVSQVLRDVFEREMRFFRGRAGAGAPDQMIDPRERQEDDVLLAILAAVWQANQPPPPEAILISEPNPAPAWERQDIEIVHPLDFMRAKYGGGRRYR